MDKSIQEFKDNTDRMMINLIHMTDREINSNVCYIDDVVHNENNENNQKEFDYLMDKMKCTCDEEIQRKSKWNKIVKEDMPEYFSLTPENSYDITYYHPIERQTNMPYFHASQPYTITIQSYMYKIQDLRRTVNNYLYLYLNNILN